MTRVQVTWHDMVTAAGRNQPGPRAIGSAGRSRGLQVAE